MNEMFFFLENLEKKSIEQKDNYRKCNVVKGLELV